MPRTRFIPRGMFQSNFTLPLGRLGGAEGPSEPPGVVWGGLHPPHTPPAQHKVRKAFSETYLIARKGRAIRSSTFHRIFQRIAVLSVVCAALVLLPARPPVAQSVAPAADITVYADALASGWEDWSWDTTVDLVNAAPVHSGGKSIEADYTAADAGLYLHTNTALGGSSYSAVRFWIHGGATSHPLQFMVITANDQESGITPCPHAPGQHLDRGDGAALERR